MTTIQAGEFWVADIPFTSGGATKKRPVLVLWLDREDVIVAAVTSASPRTPTDILLNDWKTSGLRVASTVRLFRLDCLEQSLLLFRLGQISTTDGERIKEAWEIYVKPRF
ncbi:type II toxin-antitoxin system PemK/MazF family toxin [Spirulina sp. 06S082]|uniref:type II toxin-antitoxin system PemK/MazF family toxin n=1 Tax=Spirulina sp. 06S082 TaxID=3110248 RepID=UPI002B1FC0B7|nr:type II toxin-antitoxin system PemK/MazF family toxin [Spirulina sp. 06S082]MEA5467826.1 type II toxin-antitoxin system PemK/MazF family toxin [Spirulina sp. 06S082]